MLAHLISISVLKQAFNLNTDTVQGVVNGFLRFTDAQRNTLHGPATNIKVKNCFFVERENLSNSVFQPMRFIGRECVNQRILFPLCRRMCFGPFYRPIPGRILPQCGDHGIPDADFGIQAKADIFLKAVITEDRPIESKSCFLLQILFCNGNALFQRDKRRKKTGTHGRNERRKLFTDPFKSGFIPFSCSFQKTIQFILQRFLRNSLQIYEYIIA